ncbi:MAG TPA: hypothetical protein VF032_00805, partial [Thermoleophilaceae bacterium]
DVADFPELAMRLFATDSMAHVVFSNCVGEVTLKDRDAVHKDIERLKTRSVTRTHPTRSWGR